MLQSIRSSSTEEGRIEQMIVHACCTSKEFLEKFLVLGSTSLFENPWHRRIVEWCQEYFEKFKEAPGTEYLLDIAARKSDGLQDADKIVLSASLQAVLDREPIGNIDFILSEAVNYLNSRKLLLLQQQLEDAPLQRKKELIDKFSLLDIAEQTWLDPFSNADLVKSAFKAQLEPLLALPGAIGELLNNQLVRGSFVSFLGHQKIGKSWLLLEFVFRAMEAGRKVAYFQIGDMTAAQVIRRMGIRCRKISDDKIYLAEMPIPVLDCLRNQLCTCSSALPQQPTADIKSGKAIRFSNCTLRKGDKNCGHTPCIKCKDDSNFIGSVWHVTRPQVPFSNATTGKNAAEAMQAWHANCPSASLRMEAHHLISAIQLRNRLRSWRQTENWVPDVLIVDYADSLAPIDSSMQFRHQINATWETLRQISLEFDCCLITATQANIASHETYLLNTSNFSEDNRKFNWVTCFAGLNQARPPIANSDEKKLGMLRMNILLQREGEFNPAKQVAILQHLASGQAMLDSFWVD